MKYAFVTFSCPELAWEPLARLARSAGYDGIEPRVGIGHRHGVELTLSADERRALREAAQEAGLAIPCLGTSCEYVDPASAPEQIALTRRYVDLAADIGSPLVKVFCGELPPETKPQTYMDGIARCLREVGDYAEARGVRIVVETHDDWSNPADIAELLALAGHRSVGALWDVMHTRREGGAEMERAYRLLQPWLAHVHFHDGMLRRDRLEFRTIGEGDIDHRQLLRLLRDGRYDGWLAGEWVGWEPADVHLPRELEAMKQLERQSEERGNDGHGGA